LRGGIGGNTGVVPLYACDRCGFTSTAFRVDAARAHNVEYPECDGSVQIIFRSDERRRAPEAHPDAAPKPAASSTAGTASSANSSPAGPPRRPFRMRERRDADGLVRLTILGELDLAVTDQLDERLRELRAIGHGVRIDLSQLAFIDSSGVQALLIALAEGRCNGWQLEVARQVSPSVERAARVAGIARALWPEQPAGASAAATKPSATAA
jgi:anti-anti-sigma factor